MEPSGRPRLKGDNFTNFTIISYCIILFISFIWQINIFANLLITIFEIDIIFVVGPVNNSMETVTRVKIPLEKSWIYFFPSLNYV